jgi:acetoacetyl-CoA reductase/3-oxoacyl-[acyl-carrier protein] reductase
MATAKLFSQNGYPVILVGRHREKLDAVAEKLKGRRIVMPCDVRRDEEVSWMIKDALKEMGSIGCIVNNAGIFERKPFVDTTDVDWKSQMETNLYGPTRLIRHIIPHFKSAGGGCVVNVSSTLGLHPATGTAVYSASKAALINLTRCLALELAPLNIRGMLWRLALSKPHTWEASSLKTKFRKRVSR